MEHSDWLVFGRAITITMETVCFPIFFSLQENQVERNGKKFLKGELNFSLEQYKNCSKRNLVLHIKGYRLSLSFHQVGKRAIGQRNNAI